MRLNVQRLGPAPIDARAQQVMVPMRDGVHLATDLYLPDAGSRFPAVLVRLPYDKCGRYTFMPYLAPHFVDRGYAFVVQDVRGKFRSEGETVPFIHEVADGYDTIDWIVQQSWCDGAVGMWGDSYYGFTQWAAVASGHPALRAIVPRVTSADLHLIHAWSGSQVPALYAADYLAHYWVDSSIYEYEVDWSHRPLCELFDEGFAAIGTRSEGLDTILRCEAGTVEAPAMYPAGHPFDGRKIPVLHSAGWFDNLLPDSMRDYVALRSRSDRTHLQYLNVDSTDHENYRLADLPITPECDHDTVDEALALMIPGYVGPGLDFFDVFLRQTSEVGRIAMVRWHLGNEGWHSASNWPPTGARELRLFLGDAPRAPIGPEGGALLASPERAAAQARWLHDPAHLVPSTVENPFAFLREFPDERDVERRDDVVTFTTGSFNTPLDLAGPVSACLRVGSSGPSMHIFAKLVDVAPDGSARMIARGQALVRNPDPEHRIRVEMSHVGYRLQVGHRLRLQVACSDFPLYLWHPGNDENPWFAETMQSNEQTIVAGGENGSHISLTVLETEH